MAVHSRETPSVALSEAAMLANVRLASEAVLRAWPEAQAAVLFGSRARGDNDPDSDWDVAFIIKEGSRIDTLPTEMASFMNCLPCAVQSSVLPLTVIQKKSLTVGHIGRAVTRDGLLLAGKWIRPQVNGRLMIDPDEYRKQLEVLASCLRNAANLFGEIGDSDLSLSSDGNRCDEFVAETADAAEHLAKALLNRNRIDWKKIHDIDALARQAESGGNKELAKKLRMLNGAVHKDHVAVYGVERASPDDCVHAAERIAAVTFLLERELREGVSSVIPATMIQPIASRAMRIAHDAQKKFRSARSRPPDPGHDAFSRARVDALLECRDLLHGAFERLETTIATEFRPSSSES